MWNEYSVAAHWPGEFDEAALQKWAEELRNQLHAPRVSLGVVFMTPKFFPHAAQVLELFRVHARIPLLAGCSSTSLIAGDREIEEKAGLVLGLYHLPGATLQPFHFTQAQLEEATGPGYWHQETGLTTEQINGWLVFADPFRLDCESWLRSWNEAYAPLPVVGVPLPLPATSLTLAPPLPNPANGRVSLSFALPARARVSFKLFDAAGRSVATLVECVLEPGEHHAALDALRFPAGVYLCRLEAVGEVRTRKIEIAR